MCCRSWNGAVVDCLTFSALHTLNCNCCSPMSVARIEIIGAPQAGCAIHQFADDNNDRCRHPRHRCVIGQAYGIPTKTPPSDMFLPIFHQPPPPSPTTYLHHARDCWLQFIPPTVQKPKWRRNFETNKENRLSWHRS